MGVCSNDCAPPPCQEGYPVVALRASLPCPLSPCCTPHLPSPCCRPAPLCACLQVRLVCAHSTLLDRMDPSAKEFAAKWLHQNGVEVVTGTRIRWAGC